MRIDVESILRKRIGPAARWLPGFLFSPLRWLIHEDYINAYLAQNRSGVDFCRGALDTLQVQVEVRGAENLPPVGSASTFVCNHPLGAIDGLSLGAILGEHYDGKIKYLVNDFLMNLEGLAPLCVPINVVGGRQSRDLPAAIDQAFSSDCNIIMFPAKLCSRRIDGVVQDLPWGKAFVTKSVQHHRNIVPMYFEGENSGLFYGVANFCRRLHLPNFAMALLPNEMYCGRGRHYVLHVGKPIPWQIFEGQKSPLESAKTVRSISLSLPQGDTSLYDSLIRSAVPVEIEASTEPVPSAPAEIVSPVPVDQLLEELTEDKFLRATSRGGNHLYVVTAQNSPRVMRELGRLREITYRAAGGGTGQALDIDEFDDFCQQLVVWDPEDQVILGSYRFCMGSRWPLRDDGQPHLATSHVYHFSERFMHDYAAHTIELGRSFVTYGYQGTQTGRKSIYVLDNLWEGLGCIVARNPEVKYLLGKVTMYPQFDITAHDLIMHFLGRYFPDPDGLISPLKPLLLHTSTDWLEQTLCGTDRASDYRILQREVRARGERIPPLLSAYIGLSDTMRVFGNVCDEQFGHVEGIGILITVADLYPDKYERYIKP